MGKQEDFVLRALEERDVRFVRLWFTDVLGYLKSVAIAPAELEGAFGEGIGFDGSAIEGFARVYEADMLAKPDPSTFQILPWRGEGPSTARMFCDIVMPDGCPSYADPRFVLKRTLSKAAENGFTFYTHPEVEFYLFKDTPTPGGEPVPVDRSGYFDHTAQSMGSDFRREAITMLEAMGISVEFSPPRGRPRPAGDRPSLRRRAVHGGQHHDLPHGGAGGGAEPGHLGDVHAQAVHHAPRVGHAHPRLAVRGRHATRSSRPGGVPALEDRPPVHRGRPDARSRDRGRHEPVGELLQAADVGWRGAVVHLLGPQQPLRDGPGADVQAQQGPVDPHGAAHDRLRVQPLPRVRRAARGRHEGHRGGLRAAARGRGRRLVAHRAGTRSLGIDPLPKSLYDAIAVAENSELLAETLGEHVFDFFLRNKRAEWEEYRVQVSAFERDRMLPLL